MPSFGNIYGPPSANYGKPVIKAAPKATPVPTASASGPRGGGYMPASSTPSYGYGRSMAGAAPTNVAVNITTNKVTPTVTPKTVASAVSKATNARR
jgi:hypothetical protein